MVALKGSFGPGFTDDFGEGGPEIKDDTVGMDAPAIELTEEFFGYPTAIEPGYGFDMENSNLKSISGDLFIPPSPSGYIFINREGSRELELAKGLREMILGGQALLPSI